MTLRVIIVDDEPLARDLLAAILGGIPGIEIVAQCQNGFEAVKAVLDLSPDLMFLDIEMPGMTGLDVVRAIQSDVMPLVIFTTAYAQYAVEAFKVRALNYVLKPLDETAVTESLQRAQILLRAQQKRPGGGAMSKIQMLTALTPSADDAGTAVIVKSSDAISFVDEAQIDWAEAEGDYVCLHIGQQTRLIRSTLKAVETRLSSPSFLRIHRSTLVNLNSIKEIVRGKKGEATIITKAGHSLKVSRTYGRALRAKLA